MHVVHVTFEWVRVSTDHWALRAFDLHVRPVTTHDVHLAIVPADNKHGVIKVLILCSLTITAKKRNGDGPLVGVISARKDWGDLLCLWDVSAHCANESWGVPFLHMHVDLMRMNQVGAVCTLTCNQHKQKFTLKEMIAIEHYCIVDTTLSYLTILTNPCNPDRYTWLLTTWNTSDNPSVQALVCPPTTFLWKHAQSQVKNSNSMMILWIRVTGGQGGAPPSHG